MNKITNRIEKIAVILLFIIITAIGSYFNFNKENQISHSSYETSNIPEYSGETYILINNNIPKFTTEDMNLEEDYYSDLENKRVRNGDGKDKLGKS